VSGIVVGYEAVENGRQGIASTCNRLIELVEDLSGDLKEIDSVWSGAASEAFQSAYAAWNKASNSLVADLQYIHNQVCVAQTNFAAADSAALATWQAD
jgi:WXG100 family type VII secretion target